MSLKAKSLDLDEDEMPPETIVGYSVDITNENYRPIGLQKTIDKVPPGTYEVSFDSLGVYLAKVAIQPSRVDKLDELQRSVIERVATFFKSGDKYRALGFAHKRGMLLHGAPGCGKSTLLRHIAETMVTNGGINILYKNASSAQTGVQIIRQRFNCPISVLIEDLDGFVEDGGEEDILDLLDGMQDQDNVLYIATSNYIEKLSARMLRKSRFDEHIEIGMPSESIRRELLEARIKNPDTVNKLLALTDGKSVAEVKDAILEELVFRV